jgi:hypothetical protein
MSMHTDKKTGELLSSDEIVERARELDRAIVLKDEEIGEAAATLKGLKEDREELVRLLRAAVRPVPLFDTPGEYRVTMTVTDKDAKPV